jgi:hypothetical protein
VVTRSSATERSRAEVEVKNSRGRNEGRGLPGGGILRPGETWSALSFRLSLKMHLTHSALQATWVASIAAV